MASARLKNKLQIIQTTAIRAAHHLPSYLSITYLHNISGMKTINECLDLLGYYEQYISKEKDNQSVKKTN
jgi:hypothetical protein